MFLRLSHVCIFFWRIIPEEYEEFDIFSAPVTPDGIISIMRSSYNYRPVTIRAMFTIVDTKWLIEMIFLNVRNYFFEIDSLFWFFWAEKSRTHSNETISTEIGIFKWIFWKIIEKNSFFCTPKSLKNIYLYCLKFCIRNMSLKSKHRHHVSSSPIDDIIIKRRTTLHTISSRGKVNFFTNAMISTTEAIVTVPSEFLFYFFPVFFFELIHTSSLIICESILRDSTVSRENICDKSLILKRTEIPKKTMKAVRWLSIKICTFYIPIFVKWKGGVEFSAFSQPLEYRFSCAKHYLHPVVPISLIENNTSIKQSIIEYTRISDIEIAKMPSRNAVFLGRGKSFFVDNTNNVR